MKLPPFVSLMPADSPMHLFLLVVSLGEVCSGISYLPALYPHEMNFPFFGKQLRTCLSFMGTSVSVSLFPVLREPMNTSVTAFSNSAVLKLVVCIK
jgi:hypothetical protein